MQNDERWAGKKLLMHENTCVHHKETYGSLRIKHNSTKIRFETGRGLRTLQGDKKLIRAEPFFPLTSGSW